DDDVRTAHAPELQVLLLAEAGDHAHGLRECAHGHHDQHGRVVATDAHDHRVRALDAGDLQQLLARCIAVQPHVALRGGALDRLGLTVDHDDLVACPAALHELAGRDRAAVPVATHNNMSFELTL